MIYAKYLLRLSFLLLTTWATAQTGPAQRTALLNLQKANIVESSRAGQIPLTNTDGNQRYAQYTEIDLVPIGYTPTATGNTQNYSEFVTTATGDIYYIDWQGRGLLIGGGGAGSCDLDWLEIGDNSCPDAITDSIYHKKYASIGARLVWPDAELLVNDSLSDGVVMVTGDRRARLVFYDNFDGSYGGIEHSGSNLNLIVDSTGSIQFQNAYNGSPALPGNRTTYGSINALDSTLQLNAFGSTRPADTQPLDNVAYFGPDGKVRKRPIGDLATAPDTMHITQANHQFLRGNLLYVANRFGVKANADSVFANAVVISRSSANAYIVQFSGVTDSLTNVQYMKYYYTGSISGEPTQVPPTKSQVAYVGTGNGRAQLMFSNTLSYERQNGDSYINRVLSIKRSNIAAYYPMNETSGTTMIDARSGNNGTYSNVTLNQTGFGDTQNSASFSATNAYATLGASALSAFNGSEGGISMWVYMTTELTDGLEHFLFRGTNGTSVITIKKTAANNTLQFSYVGNTLNFTGLKSGWNHVAFTWSQRNDIMNAWINGVPLPEGSGTNILLPVYSGGALTSFIVGNNVAGSTTSIGGKIQHFCIWNNYLSNGEINRLSALQGVDFTPHPTLKTVSQKMLRKKVASEANDWLGRAAMISISSSLWAMTYRAGLDHNNGGGDLIHIMFSSDQGATWGKRDTLLDGVTPVGGFPLTMHATTINIPGADIMIAPNGNLLCLATEEQPSGHKIYQYRSTNNGNTWTDEGITFPNNLVGEEDYAIISGGVNAGLYVLVRNISAPSEDIEVYRTTNNGTSWSKRGDIETAIDANESGLETLGGDTLICILKTSDQSATYKYLSYDAGATWSARIYQTDALSEMNKPRLKKYGNSLYLVGRQQLRKQNWGFPVIFKSTDNGVIWSQPLNPDSMVINGDNGYGDILQRTNGDIYYVSYNGILQSAQLSAYVVRDTIYTPISSPIGLSDVAISITTNIVPKGNLNSNGLVNSQIIDNATNVGINTTAPQAKLQVQKSAVGSAGSYTSALAVGLFDNNDENAVVGLRTNRTRINQLMLGDDTDRFGVGLYGYGSSHATFPKRFSVFVDGAPRLTVDSLTRVGVGIQTPKSPLHVWMNGTSNPSGNAGIFLQRENDDINISLMTNSVRIAGIFLGETASINSGFINHAMSAYAGAGGPNRMTFGTSATERMSLGLGLNVGVGTFTQATGTINAQTGYRVNDAAPSGQYLRGDGTKFVPSTIQAADLPSGFAWQLTGNAVTAGTQWLGSSNNVSLRFRTNNLLRMIIDSSGMVGVNKALPSALVHLGPGMSTADGGQLKFDSSAELTVKEKGVINYTGKHYSMTLNDSLRLTVPGVIWGDTDAAKSVGTSETTLYAKKIKGRTFNNSNGAMIHSVIVGNIADATSVNAQIKIYAFGTLIMDTGAQAVTAISSWKADVYMENTGTNIIQTCVVITAPGLTGQLFTANTTLTSLSLGLPNDFIITATATGAGATNDDITAQWQKGVFYPTERP